MASVGAGDCSEVEKTNQKDSDTAKLVNKA